MTEQTDKERELAIEQAEWERACALTQWVNEHIVIVHSEDVGKFFTTEQRADMEGFFPDEIFKKFNKRHQKRMKRRAK